MSVRTENILSEHLALAKHVASDPGLNGQMDKAAKILVSAFKRNARLLICGNGGSAADSQHLATEFVSRFFMERRALDAEALTINTSSLTAIGNDYDFERVFSRQVEAKGRKGDVLLGISTSGTSKNVAKALETASKMGLKTITFIGGNKKCVLHDQADCCISVPSSCTPRVQEIHILIGHALCEIVEEELFGG